MENLTITEDKAARLTTYRILDRYTFTVPMLDPGPAATEAPIHFKIALNAAAIFARDSAALMSDQTLSVFGLNQKLDPMRQTIIETIARCSRNIDTFEILNLDEEAKLVLVPPLAVGDVVGALDDREIRDYWRAATPSQRSSMMKRIRDKAPGADRFALAILRSPVPMDSLVDLTREIWSDAQRSAYPEQAAEIDDGKTAIEWARRALSHLAGVLPALPSIERERIEAYILGSSDPNVHAGARVFGIDPDHITRLRLRASMQQQAA